MMSDEQIRQHFQVIRQQIAAQLGEDTAGWREVDAALEDLQVIYEQMQASLEAIEEVEAELFQRQQDYQDLFQFFPIASLITNANGLILDANQAIAQLLNVPYSYLVGKPLAVFVAEKERARFRTHLNRLSQSEGIQIWHTRLCPRDSEPILTEFQVVIARDIEGRIERLRIGVYNLSQSQAALASLVARTSVASQIPQPLDGLQVLVVDDDMDVREFVTMVLETHGIGVRTVASAAAALEELERFRPDVLISDLRMPGEDGYSLIRRIREREAEQGGHLPAAAITAYLDEDKAKAIAAGFEAHLHKLVQPSEWVKMVAQLARQASSPE